ncbi:23S rRNA methyltransferase [Ureibacillus sp. FSL K6-8385]|uniref:23S rRNA methyltransferase n=2 Tax=Bacillati TaxID=1783272 RepID=A0A540V7N9_9CHLR|nr:23S rRNA methyltransferase [Ureibacillus terrenus]MED3660710.1 23S rRNA methyltransferase [Ureibacillus terrenus]MED3762896.1 23S rRNA methyltransferase [Ureibacillus terrenus]TQE92301.1 23S rRNA methyltransferase [Ureibacillus terrenus]
MRKYHLFIAVVCSIFLLSGCSSIKDAISGIQTQAEKAKSGLTIDAFSLRESEIEYKGATFTVEELFKTILRDVQWEYEKNQDEHLLMVKGTWQEPLFDDLQLTDKQKEELSTTGKILIQLIFENDRLIPDQTAVTMKLKEKTLVDEKGEEILHYFCDLYLKEYKQQ